jgi:hypothetical protein
MQGWIRLHQEKMNIWGQDWSLPVAQERVVKMMSDQLVACAQ